MLFEKIQYVQVKSSFLFTFLNNLAITTIFFNLWYLLTFILTTNYYLLLSYIISLLFLSSLEIILVYITLLNKRHINFNSSRISNSFFLNFQKLNYSNKKNNIYSKIIFLKLL